MPEIVKENKFDLLIVRDLLEHLRDPSQFLENAEKVLKKDGFIFIITPNGWEDAWPAYQYGSFRSLVQLEKNPYVIFLNHFHYFMPSTLEKLLSNSGFMLRSKFKFGLKRFKNGLGVIKRNTADMSRPDLKNLQGAQESFLKHWEHNPSFISKEVLHNNSFVSKIYSTITDREKEQVDFFDTNGHEFFILAQKK